MCSRLSHTYAVPVLYPEPRLTFRAAWTKDIVSCDKLIGRDPIILYGNIVVIPIRSLFVLIPVSRNTAWLCGQRNSGPRAAGGHCLT